MTSTVGGRTTSMGEPESLADRILRIRLEQETDPIAELLLEVRAEARATRELLEEARKKGGGGGIGNGRFSLVRDVIVIVLVPLAFALGALVVNNADRLARIETRIEEAVTMDQLSQLEVRARAERMEAIDMLRQELRRHEDRER